MDNQLLDKNKPEAEAPQVSAKPDGRSRNVILGGAAGAALICCCLVALVTGLVLIDPFGWQIMDRLSGRYDPVASAMPEDTAMYIGIDALAFNPQKINRILRPFLEAAEEPDLTDAESALDEFDQELRAELGVTIQDDILPWIGQYAGLGISDIRTDFSGDIQELRLLAAISTRDRKASDAFLEKLAAGMTESTGNLFSQESYEGVTIYVMNSDDPVEQLAFARSDSLVLIGTGLAEVQQAIDVQYSASLAATDNYKTVISELPSDRGLTVYVNGTLFEELMDGVDSGAGIGLSPDSLSAINFKSAATALSIIDDGLELDIVSLSEVGLVDTATNEWVEAGQSLKPADQFFPEQTVMLISGQRFDLTWSAIREGFVSENSQADWDESMALFADEFSVNPDTELMPYLDGEWGLGVLPADVGLLTDALDIPLGFAWLVGTSEPAKLAPALNSLADGLDFQGFSIQQQPLADGFVYSVSLSAGDDPMLVYGLDGNQMYLASDADTIERLMASVGPILAESDHYRQLWTAFPRDHSPAFYLDVQGLLDALQEGLSDLDREDFEDALPILKPLTFVAATSDSEIAGDDLIRHVSTIFFIEPTE